MTRDEMDREMEATVGFVPEFATHMPPSTLEHEWAVIKQTEMAPGAIPQKYRELIGLALAGVLKCKYCLVWHGEGATSAGCTEEEVEEALHIAMNTAGWSTWLTGMRIDFERFQQDVLRMHELAAQAAAE